jgi:hypothetical protein
VMSDRPLCTRCTARAASAEAHREVLQHVIKHLVQICRLLIRDLIPDGHRVGRGCWCGHGGAGEAACVRAVCEPPSARLREGWHVLELLWGQRSGLCVWCLRLQRLAGGDLPGWRRCVSKLGCAMTAPRAAPRWRGCVLRASGALLHGGVVLPGLRTS